MLCARGQLGLEVAVQNVQPLQAGANLFEPCFDRSWSL